MNDLFTLACSAIPDLRFVGFRGKEQISRPYEFELFFTVPTGTSMSHVVGQRATIKGARSEDAVPVVFHGILAELTLLHQASNERGPRHRSLYRALLVPRLWSLQHSWRSFVFTKKNVKKFLTDTLKAGGLAEDEFKFEIDDGAHPEEEFVAQYRESHLDFFNRWCEREGLYYYFEHKEEPAHETLVIVDDKSHEVPFPGGGKVTYFPLAGDDGSAPEGLHQLHADHRWLPAVVTVTDYDYSKPTNPLLADGQVTKAGVGIIRDYGHRTFAQDDAKRLAKVKAESIGCRETTLQGHGTCLGPRPGYKLEIQHRPDDLDEEWLAIEVEHSATVGAATAETARLTGLSTTHTYTMKLLATPAAVQYRAPQATKWPRVFGFENGVIMGESESPYAQIDADGRYLVRFSFDTSDLPDGNVSTRVRMLQPHGGTKEGHHFPLRKGTEVMIAFLGGDPDRPFIQGVMPNAHKPSTVVQRNYTQNIIRTGSDNELVLEDLQGKEFIYMHTPNQNAGIYMGVPTPRAFVDPDSAKPGLSTTIDGAQVSLYLNTDANAGLSVGGSMWTDIGSNEYIFVGGNVSHGYGGTFKLQVGEATTEHYYADQTITVDGNRVEEVIGTVTEKYGPQHTEVRGAGKLKIQNEWLHKVGAKNDDNYGEWKTHVGGPWTLTAEKVDWKVRTLLIAASGTFKGIAKKVEFDCTLYLNLAPLWITNSGNTNEVGDADKFSLGIAKTEAVGSSTADTGIKIDGTGASASATGIKFDYAGLSMGTFQSKTEVGLVKIGIGLNKKTAAVANYTGGILVRLFAFQRTG